MFLGNHAGQTRSRLLWIGGIVLLLIGALELLAVPPAAAKIQFLEEAPGQIVYQSRQTVQDALGNSWQAIAFKRLDASDSRATLSLRLVGFPGTVNLNHAQPLTLIPSRGETLTAPDVSSQISSDHPPEPNVGQYDLQSVLPQLKSAIGLQLLLPTTQDNPVEISISPVVIEEWKVVSSCQALMCSQTD